MVDTITTWAAAPDGNILKSDVSIAKNYLSEQEMRSLERIVSAYLDWARTVRSATYRWIWKTGRSDWIYS